MTGTEREVEPGPLAGAEVALTGRLLSMTRDEAARRIATAGGRYVPEVTTDTALVVVGGDGPPLNDDGRPTRALRRARVLQEMGRAVRVIPEEEFLALLGLERRSADLHRLYTTGQLARIVCIPQHQVRAWIRHGLLRPVRTLKRLCFFDFRQVAAARDLSRLRRAGISPLRIRRSLQLVARWLPDQEPLLSQLEALDRRGPLLVRLEDGRLLEAGGQLRLDFVDRDGTPEPAPTRRMPTPRLSKANDWFEQGLAHEEDGRLEEAVRAYERSAELEPRHAEVHFNLGNTLYALDRKREAMTCFQHAVRIEPDYVEAWNNFGNALSDTGHLADAVAAYRRALALAKDYADAHYNLAETLALMNDVDAAREHWLAYLERDPTSTWADQVRQRLELL